MRQRKIPTLLGFFLTLVLVVGLAVTTSLAQKVTRIFSRADQSLAPTSVGVGNTTDSGFTVYWTTEAKAPGTVFFGASQTLGDGTAIDDRDSPGTSGKYTTHLARVIGLSAQTKYYFKIGSGAGSFGDSTKSDAPFEVKTGPKVTAMTADPIFGKVLDSSGPPASGVIVVWETAGAGKIATISKTDGTFLLPISNARNEDLNQVFDTSSVPSETISLFTSSTDKAVITCKPGLDKPLPTVKLGENIDCSKTTNQGQNLPGGGSKMPAGSGSGGLRVNISDGETVPSSLPTISGRAGANQVVKVEVHSDTAYSGTVIAGPDGSWSWTPPANLSPGQHTVTITVVNADGTTQMITRTFNVSASEPILPITSGTPSASLTHLACVSNSCTKVAGAGPDSCTTNSDCVQPPVAPPMATPSPQPVNPPPVTGSVQQTWLLAGLGLMLVVSGLALGGFRLLSRVI